MIRVLAFLLSVVCCAGLICGAYTGIADTGDEISFRETVRFGDPSVMDGRTAGVAIRCGDHMLWEFDYHFGPEDRCDTEFTFSQSNLHYPLRKEDDPLSVYVHSGVGMSVSGGNGFSFSNIGYGNMIRTVAALTPDGGKLEMNLKIRDYLDYHNLNFNLDYASDTYFCMEYVDMFNQISHGNQVDSLCYEAFSQLFRFPVLDDQIASIQVGKDSAGNVVDVFFNVENNIEISMVNAATDDGVYCIPRYLKDFKEGTIIPGEYALGMGMYLIPWKPNHTAQSNGREVVTLDVENAKNIYPLPETAVACGLKVDEQTNTAWLLTLEEGVYFLTKLDLTSQVTLSRLELMDNDPEQRWVLPGWYCRDALMMVHAGDQLALVTVGEEPRVEFIIGMGAVSDGMHDYTADTGAMLYEDGVLYLADQPYYNYALNVMAFDKTGPLYWGEYACALTDCDEFGGRPYFHTQYMVTGLE